MYQYHYLYKITNLINQKIYIGVHSTDNIDDSYFGSGVALHRAINKYNKDNFKKEILEWFDWKCESLQREAEIVNEEFVKRNDTYNLKTGGIGGLLSCDTKHKISSSRMGIIFSDDHKENLRRSHIGYKATDETKKKISDANKGLNNKFFGKTFTVEQLNKIKDVRKNQVRLATKSVIINDIKFDSIKLACDYFHLHASQISVRLKSEKFSNYRYA